MYRTDVAVGKIAGSSPSENKYYVLVLFDISDSKKYRVLTRLLKKYGIRVQKSVFEAHLQQAQIKELVAAIDRIMLSERFYNPDDNIRVYRIASNCEVTVFGQYVSSVMEDNIFF